MEAMYIILNHTLVQAEKALIPVSDRGFRYGDGVFETIAVHGGVPYRFDWHLSRLKKALEAIRMTMRVDYLRDECEILLEANRIKEGLLRIQITRGVGGRGYLPAADAKPTSVVETLPPAELPVGPVTLMASSFGKIPPSALPVYKHCNALNATLARMEAADNGCFDALMLGEKGTLADTSSANIFWVRQNTLFTPALECGALSGSVRAALLECSPYPVREVRATVATLAGADAVFLTNVAWKIVPVGELKPLGLRWQSERTAQFFRAILLKDMDRYSREHRERWQSVGAEQRAPNYA
jgi:branched-subunit amino acid aminotransferase/4-amino-4-deoxychorismate lyase